MNKSSISAISFLATFIFLSATQREIQHEAAAINIEVPVRVFDGGAFVDYLSMKDFEVYEDGILQEIDAVYLVKKTNIEKEETIEAPETKKVAPPKVSRYFVLCFILTEYLPRVKEAVDYFIGDVFLRGDTLTIITPIKTYNLKNEILDKLTSQEINNQLRSLLRKDILLGNYEYRKTVNELITYAQSGQVDRYAIAMDYLKQLRYVDQKRLIEFANYLKSREGQKHVFLFYQMESLPLLEPAVIEGVDPTRPGSMKKATFFWDIITEGISLDVDLVQRAYSDSLTSIHFLYITKNITDPIDVNRIGSLEGLRFIDKSGDIFSAFNEMAKATGGISESTANISFALKRASNASENYYLLYYSPRDYKSDGKFKNIKVKIKGKNYRVLHRAGYLAD